MWKYLTPANKTERRVLINQVHDPSLPQIKSRTLCGRPTNAFQRRPKQIPSQASHLKGRKTLVLDLDETLVHSSFDPMECDFIITCRVDDNDEKVYVRKRPGLDEFLEDMSEAFELIIYTSSLEEYASNVIDLIDPKKRVSIRLYRENCVVYGNKIVKSLEALNRDLKDIIIIDNSETAFMLDQKNAILIKSFFQDPNDQELANMTPFLKYLSKVHDIRPISNQLKDFMDSSLIIPMETEESSITSSKESLVKKERVKRLHSLKVDFEGNLQKGFERLPKGENMNSDITDFRGYYSAQLKINEDFE